ncbi:MAG: hypothetical protein IPJ65_35325 [Archangiaceae bacterium]|nr:hypothetical protein [Archangiaceae bacterium]
MLGGALWGLLAILHLGFVFPPLQGLSRIRHEALGPTLRAYAALCFFRLTALLAWWPLVAVTAAAANAAGLTPSVARLVLLPAVLLTACFFIASLTEHLALYLDSKRVEGPATARNAWHATVRKYFLGYLKRSGIVLQRRFLERALFLPGTPDSGFEVTLYGGALGAPRILIGAKALTAALGELPDEPEGPDRQVNPEELPFGFITPADDEAGPRVEKLTERLRRRLSRAAPRSRAPAMPRLLGEPTTALGWVVPRPVDEAVPLISNTREDYEVVKGLLTEHYGRFEKNLDEDEHDDTDPTQKDFLFGALMVATGGFTRRDNLGATLASAFGARGRTRKVLRALFLLHARVFAWPRAAVADAFAALNQALHPQIQYLHLCRNGSPAVLTARADAPHLVETSKTLLEQLLESSGEEDARFLEPTEAHRMLWLAPFFAARLVRGAPRWLRAVALGAVAAALAAVVVTQVLDAVSYRPTYVERMTQMRAMADKASQGAVSK